MTVPLLSICINTKNRVNYLAETLNSIIRQIDGAVEIVVIDGASTDNTPILMRKYTLQYPFIRYFRSDAHLGIDDGYDAAVGYAIGAYCWLLPDDDLILPGTLGFVLENIKSELDLIVVNMDLYTKDLKVNLNQKFFKLNEDRVYRADEFEEFFCNHGNGLSYIGAVIIKRELWFEKERIPFFGSFFVHVGVILGSTLIKNILYLHTPIIQYRSGNVSWSARSFEIWHYKWPELIWSFQRISNETKNTVIVKQPWKRALTLLKSRAVGEYSFEVYKKYFSSEKLSWFKTYSLFMSRLPVAPVNFLLILLCVMFKRHNHFTIYNLLMASPYPALSKMLIQLFGIRLA
jgi:abequosyltransferase